MIYTYLKRRNLPCQYHSSSWRPPSFFSYGGVTRKRTKAERPRSLLRKTVQPLPDRTGRAMWYPISCGRHIRITRVPLWKACMACSVPDRRPTWDMRRLSGIGPICRLTPILPIWTPISFSTPAISQLWPTRWDTTASTQGMLPNPSITMKSCWRSAWMS